MSEDVQAGRIWHKHPGDCCSPRQGDRIPHLPVLSPIPLPAPADTTSSWAVGSRVVAQEGQPRLFVDCFPSGRAL